MAPEEPDAPVAEAGFELCDFEWWDCERATVAPIITKTATVAMRRFLLLLDLPEEVGGVDTVGAEINPSITGPDVSLVSILSPQSGQKVKRPSKE